MSPTYVLEKTWFPSSRGAGRFRFSRDFSQNESKPRTHDRLPRGFTLVELLTIIALLTLAASMLLPGLARTNPNAQTFRCLNNLRQLSCGTMMYISDNHDCFPGCGSANTYGFHVEDWVYWRVIPGFPPLEKSPIIAGFGSSSTNLFRCPADREDSERITYSDANGPYYWSYSMTSLNPGGVNLGMSSIIDFGNLLPFRLSQVKNPGGKIMLAEQQASHKPGEASNTNLSSPIISNGRWVPPGDELTVRHNHRGDVSFADGHASIVTPQFATNSASFRPDF